jgi:hypothetical protein
MTPATCLLYAVGKDSRVETVADQRLERANEDEFRIKKTVMIQQGTAKLQDRRRQKARQKALHRVEDEGAAERTNPDRGEDDRVELNSEREGIHESQESSPQMMCRCGRA